MKFDFDEIQKELREFWRTNKMNLHYVLNGKEVSPMEVSSCNFQLKNVESSNGYNIEVTALNLRVQIDSLEKPYKAKFCIKVVPGTISNVGIPGERIVGIQDDRIFLQKPI